VPRRGRGKREPDENPAPKEDSKERQESGEEKGMEFPGSILS
jgi:hypothetical protein